VTATQPLKVLVVDDSAFNQKSIADILAASPDVQVVAKASDGEEALRMVGLLQPDIITLDLEMPKMDGFTFLRILMSRTPTPVIVVSSHSQKQNVFKALELGALDFVAKPDRYADSELGGLRRELLAKVLLVRSVRAGALARPRPRFESLTGEAVERIPERAAQAPRRVIAIGASTGGPTALLEIFSRIGSHTLDAYLIAQHMPERFTRTFAERLDRRSTVRVSEASDLERLDAGTALVCPGRKCMQLETLPAGAFRLRVVPPLETDRYVPSADRLLSSVARAAGKRAVAIILTGMGDDGARGARAVMDAGGIVIAESEKSALVYGMPGSAVRTGVVTRSLSLSEIADWLNSS
jgi:two-component system chemotaxis response regulator CheB